VIRTDGRTARGVNAQLMFLMTANNVIKKLIVWKLYKNYSY